MAEALVGNIQKFSTEDGPGIRTTIFLKGCPLNCLWCHNPELISPGQELIQMPNSCIHCGYCIEVCPKDAVYVDEKKQIAIDRDLCDRCMKCADGCYAGALKRVATEMTAEEAFAEAAKDKDFYSNTGGGITLSGGEVLMHPDFAEAVTDMAEEEGISICLDTSGYGDSDFFYRLASRKNVTDILYDIKAMDPDKHLKLTGRDNGLIQDNLARLAADPIIRKKICARLPLIAGVNDGDDDMEAVADRIGELGIKKVTLLPYHDIGRSKKRHIGGGEQEHFSPPSEERLQEILEKMEKNAAEAEILGRV